MSLHLLVLAGLLLGATAADPLLRPQVSVTEAGGLYSVTAGFEIPQTASVALAGLSDYEQIARFMPEVRKSVVLDRGPKRLLIEQEALSQFLMFSKTVHLVLEVVEEEQSIRFADRSGRSFKS